MSTTFKNGASGKTSNLDTSTYTFIEKPIKQLYSYRGYSITISTGQITPCVEFRLIVQLSLSLAINDTYEEVSHWKSNSQFHLVASYSPGCIVPSHFILLYCPFMGTERCSQQNTLLH